MPYKTGQSGNPAGRKNGAINKVAKPIKEQLSEFLNEKMQELPEIWEKLSPRDRAQFLKDLFPFFLAKMQAQSIDLNMNLSSLSEEQLIFMCNELFKREKNE